MDRALHYGVAAEKTGKQASSMRRIFKYLFRLLFVLGIAFAAYAIFWDLPPPVVERTVPVPLPQGE